MLWDASTINGYAVEASDGRLGTASDLLFEDVGWDVRWLVVDTGNWLPGRKVLLPLKALGQPDPALHGFPVKLTMQQVRNSPDVSTDQPVSRQIEASVYNYYGWSSYWSDGGSALSGVLSPASLPASKPLDLDRAGAQPNGVDPNLRSIAAIIGLHVDAADGEIGHVEDFLVDDADWNIRYIKVDTKNWWPGQSVLISPRSVRRIDWSDRLVHLNVNRKKVKGSPIYDPSITVDGAYDEKFLTYYGIKWVKIK